MNAERYMLGIDPGKWTGFAIVRLDGTRVQSGAWSIKPPKGRGPGAQYLALVAYLDAVLTTFPSITWATIEGPAGNYKNGAAMLSVVGTAAHALGWCEGVQLQYDMVAPSQAKNAAGLPGNCKKPPMVAAAIARWGALSSKVRPAREGEADALWIAVAGLELLDGG